MVCVHTRVCRGMYVPMHTHVQARGGHQASFSVTLCIILLDRVPTGCGTRLGVSQQAPSIPLSPPPSTTALRAAGLCG